MSEFTFRLACAMGRFDAYSQFITVAYNRLWIELTSGPSIKYPTDDVVSYGISCLDYTAYAH